MQAITIGNCCFIGSSYLLAGNTVYHSNVAVGFCNGALCILSKRGLDPEMLHQHKQMVWT